MADTKDLSKAPQIASSGAPLKEAHANKRRDKDGNEIRLEELANFNSEILLDNYRNFLKRLHIASLVLIVASGLLLILAIALSITFLVLTGSEKRKIEEIQINSKPGEWKVDSCQLCYQFSSVENVVTANMTRNLIKDSKESETISCKYNISNFWKCNAITDINGNMEPVTNSEYYCVKN